jgi:tRNA pseudouridine55 synthase
MSSAAGILPVDKPEGPTSHDVVAMARRALGTRRIGHTGTLDPFASGLLLLCLGPATRLAEYLTGLSKTYTATVRLGASTDTDDHTGTVVSSTDAWRDLDADAIERALDAQTGHIRQLPPVYSAKKVAGERMYAAARRGQAVERTPVEVTIHSIRMLRVDLPEVEIEVHCSSGTYIRAIARDLGEALGVGGHLTALRRTRIGTHDIAGAIRVEEMADRAAVAGALMPPAAAVSHLPRVEVDEEATRKIANGGAIGVPETEQLPDGLVALVSPVGDLLALGQKEGAAIRPKKVFV